MHLRYFFRAILCFSLCDSSLFAQPNPTSYQSPLTTIHYTYNTSYSDNNTTPQFQFSVNPEFYYSNIPSTRFPMIDSELVQKEISPFRFGLVIGASAGIITLAHLQNYNSWWKGERSPFHFDNDENASLYADKFGHFYFSFIASDIISRSFLWSGLHERNAALLGGGIALAFQLYVEVEDAFHPNLGFSPGDGVADAVGAAIPLLRYHIPSLSSVTIKWSAIPSPRYRGGEFRNIIDDYESQYYWLSFNIDDVLGKHSPDFIPSFLNIALGYGVKNLSPSTNKEMEIYCGFDIDFTKLPGNGSFLKSLKHLLNYFHAPMPTLRITPDAVAYGVRF
ncbi:MAG: DUF2279 domain-containing protein [Ignavibacteriae bacterium]|nr:DUF2279 domain-containing protein [Ignavibacteriota bacterium]